MENIRPRRMESWLIGWYRSRCSVIYLVLRCLIVFAEDGELNISLAKIRVGETWMAAIHGHETLDAVEQQTEQKNAMLERFQREVRVFDVD
jgi:hypothetical protein